MHEHSAQSHLPVNAVRDHGRWECYNESGPDWTAVDKAVYHPNFPPPSNHYIQQMRPQSLPVKPSPNLYIHNVPKDAREDELKNLFSPFGTLQKIRLKVNQKIGPQAVYAFVTFSNTDEAQIALQRMDGYEMRSRRLRIEFQKSRDDDGRGDIDLISNDPDYSAQENQDHPIQVEFNPVSHKRNMPSNPSDFDYTSEPTNHYYDIREGEMKKARHFSQRLHTEDSNYPKAQRSNMSSSNCNQDLKERSKFYGGSDRIITIRLCELLEPLFPNLFRPEFSTSHPKNIEFDEAKPKPPPDRTRHKPQYQYDRPHSYSAPRAVFTNDPKAHINTSVQAERSEAKELHIGEPKHLVWNGDLVRNGKKKALVNIYYLSGYPMIPQFPKDLAVLNISHRSTWEELKKKSPQAICYFKSANARIADDGTRVLLSPQAAEVNDNVFLEHMRYFLDKQRAGVIVLSESFHLYIIPPGAPSHQQYCYQYENLISSPNQIALGLLISRIS